MPLIRALNPKLDDDNETIPLYTYTLSSENETNNGTSQILLQNNLTDDTMYLHDVLDGTSGWTLDGLPVLFSSDGQPILLNQLSTDQTDTSANTTDKISYLTTTTTAEDEVEEDETHKQNELGTNSEIHLTVDNNNSMNIDDDLPVITGDTSNKNYITVNNLYLPLKNADSGILETSAQSNIMYENNYIGNGGVLNSENSIIIQPTSANSENSIIFQPANGTDAENSIIIQQAAATNGENSIIIQPSIELKEDLLTEENVEENPADKDQVSLSCIEITDLADLVTAFKCKRCDFITADKELFLEHYSDAHLNQNWNNGGPFHLIIQNNDTNEIISLKSDETDQQVDEEEGAEEEVSVNSPKYLIETDDGVYELNPNNLLDVTNVENQLFENISSSNNYEYKQVLVCSQCTQGFNSIEDCKRHMINDHKLRESNGKSRLISPKIAGQKTDNGSQAAGESSNVDNSKTVQMSNDTQTLFDKTILKPKPANNPYKCEVRGCSFRFATEEIRDEHMKCHIINQSGNTAYKCSLCDLPQKNWRTTAVHLFRVHNIQTDLIMCPVCKVFKATQAQLNSHMSIHSDKKLYTCVQCGKNYKQPSQLRNHRVIHLDKNSDKRPSWFREKECSQCNKIFANGKSLKIHLQSVHSKLRPFICNVCGHSSPRKAMLQMHLRQHTGEKPFACTFCNYRTGDHNSLRRHEMIHTGIRPYKCPHCAYTSIQSSAYKYHISIKHPGKPGVFSCTLCSFKSVSADVYQSHVHDHQQGVIPSPKPATNNTDASNTNCEAKGSETKNNDSNSNGEFSYATGGATKSSTNNKSAQLNNDRKLSISSSDNEEPCYLRYESLGEEQCIDTGGITIPAEPECSTLLQMALLS